MGRDAAALKDLGLPAGTIPRSASSRMHVAARGGDVITARLCEQSRMPETVYCGPPPTPSTLWTHWNVDVPLIAALATLALAIVLTAPPEGRRRVALAGAVAVLVLAFVSPLCALSTALFSARVAHHVLMIAVAAPLLALAAPHWRVPIRLPFAAVTAVHGLTIWFWHAPGPYAWAVSATAPYWIMEISLMLSAFWLWSDALAPTTRSGAALGMLLTTTVQMGLLGALLTFARTPLYGPHSEATALFDLTQLEDQQLAGLIMWVPAAVPYFLAAGIIVARQLDQDKHGRHA